MELSIPTSYSRIPNTTILKEISEEVARNAEKIDLDLIARGQIVIGYDPGSPKGDFMPCKYIGAPLDPPLDQNSITIMKPEDDQNARFCESENRTAEKFY